MRKLLYKLRKNLKQGFCIHTYVIVPKLKLDWWEREYGSREHECIKCGKRKYKYI